MPSRSCMGDCSGCAKAKPSVDSRLVGGLQAALRALGDATIRSLMAIEAGLVSPAHLVVDTFPSEQGSPRVNDAATLHGRGILTVGIPRTIEPLTPSPPKSRSARSSIRQVSTDSAPLTGFISPARVATQPANGRKFY
jgi:hypothetical protein